MAAPARRSQTLTFLFSDIEGSTSMWEADPARMERAVTEHLRELRGVVHRHGGEYVKSTGDGIFATFAGVAAAVRAAAEAQRATVARGELRVRIGLHTGECTSAEGDHFGVSVNKAARIEQAAYGGQVLMSSTTAALLADDAELRGMLRDLGDHHFDGITEPERVFQLVVDGVPHRFPPLRTRDVGLQRLPAEVAPLVGRAADVADVVAVLARTRCVSVVGPPGVGKTRLAVRIATEEAWRRRDGARFVDLAPCRRADALEGTVANALGVRAEDDDVVGGVVRALRPTDALVVLDNCEHVLDPVARLVQRLLVECPRVGLLVTSQQRLGLTAEHMWPLQPLAVAAPDATLARAAESPAVQLFVARATSVQPSFELTEANLDPVLRLCRSLDGLPLALELAAARLEALGVAELADRVSSSIDVLEPPEPGGHRPSARHHGLRQAVATGYDALEPHDRLLFDELAAFAGHASADAVEEVTRLGSDVRGGLERLARRSLLSVEERPSGTRYRLLESMRSFALEHGRVDDELEARHARHFVGSAVELGARYLTVEAPSALGELVDQFDDFRLAWQRLADRRQWLDAGRLIVALHEFCLYTLRTEHQAWAEATAPHLGDGEQEAAALWGVVATGRWFRGDHEGALAAGRRALAAAGPGPEPGTTIWAHTALMNAMGFLGDLPGATSHMAALVRESRAAEQPFWQLNAVVTEALGLATVGRHDLAREPARRAVAMAEAVGAPAARCWSLFVLALALRPDDIDGADVTLDHALAVARSSGDRWNESIILMERLSVHTDQGRTAEAAATALDLIGHLEHVGGFGQLWQAVHLSASLLGNAGHGELAATLHLAVRDRPAMPRPAGADVTAPLGRLVASLDDRARRRATARAAAWAGAEVVDACRRALEELLAEGSPPGQAGSSSTSGISRSVLRW